MQPISKVAGLLNLPEYQGYILLGLVFSIGGIDAPLADTCSEVLCAQLDTGEHLASKT